MYSEPRTGGFLWQFLLGALCFALGLVLLTEPASATPVSGLFGLVADTIILRGGCAARRIADQN
jgi:hypothetical protein